MTTDSSPATGKLFVENANLKAFEPLVQQNPAPVLSLLDTSQTASLPSSTPLDQISVTIPYAVCLFNKGYYWETHEVLEDVWMDEHGPTRPFLQGFIQAAAALYHVVAQNPPGYERLSRLARQKLAPLKMPMLGVDLSTCLESFLTFDMSMKGAERFDLAGLPKITFAGIKL